VLRCREAINADLLRARHRLSKFLLRHDRRYTQTKGAWGPRHTAWLRSLQWPLPALEQTFGAYLRAVEETATRLAMLDEELRGDFRSEPFAESVRRLRCFRGSVISAH
jgi:transposase